ncbi:DUF3077 domain-containing protein [Pseudomonas sp. TE3610]
MTFESTAPSPAPRATVNTTFGTCDSQDLPFYSVRAGIPMDDALVQISHLLKCATESAYELSDDGIAQSGLLWSALHAMEAAKALADALIDGVSRNPL